jgi:dTDP-glucose 4,6-dehydratase
MNVRDWLHVEDHCRGIELALTKGRVGERYNIGGGVELPNLTLIDKLCAAIDAAFAADPDLARRFPLSPPAQGKPTSVLKTFITDRPGHDRRYSVDETKSRAELGYHPRHTLDTGFADTLAWYLDNESWWRAVLDGSYQTRPPR